MKKSLKNTYIYLSKWTLINLVMVRVLEFKEIFAHFDFSEVFQFGQTNFPQTYTYAETEEKGSFHNLGTWKTPCSFFVISFDKCVCASENTLIQCELPLHCIYIYFLFIWNKHFSRAKQSLSTHTFGIWFHVFAFCSTSTI